MLDEQHNKADLVVSSDKEWGNILASIEFVVSQDLPKHATLLDVGCHIGSLIYSLRQQGYCNVQGIDIDRRSVKRGRALYPELANRIETYEGTTLPYQDASFDVVTMFDVLEHIEYIEKFLMLEISRVLKKGGMLLFQTPNKYTNIPWEIVVHKSLTYYKTYHVSLQSYNNLKKLLSRSGFVDIAIEKRDIRTEYYKTQLKKHLGPLSGPALFLLNCLPTRLSTNFWGRCKKPKL